MLVIATGFAPMAIVPMASASPSSVGGSVGVAAALAPTGATKTIVRDATLSTSGQNMWGSGASAPLDKTFSLFNQSFNESGSFDEIARACVDFEIEEVCGRFGASSSATISGSIGMSMTIQGIDGGSLSVNYPVEVTFTAPDDNSFSPGDTVDIKTSMVVDSANATIVASFPALDRIGLNGSISAAATVNAKACLFDCIEANPLFSFNESGSGEIVGVDASNLNLGCANFLVSFPLGLSTNSAANKCGGKAFVFNPDVTVGSTLNPDGTIAASGSDQYVNIPVSLVTWLGRAAGLPLYIQLNPEVSFGGVGFGWTTFNAIISALETMKQDFLFSPRVDVNLDWGKDLEYSVINGVNGTTVVSLQQGQDATLRVGDTLRLTTNESNNKIIPITPTLSMGSATMSNSTRSATSGNLELRALGATITVPRFEVCDPTGAGLGCLKIWSATSETEGPLYVENFPLGSIDKSIFNDTFDIGGFNMPALQPFDIVPRPVVEVRKNLVPSNSPGTFDLAIDGVLLADDAADEGTTGRVVVEPGTRTVSESNGTGGDVNFFDVSITCVEFDGGAVHTQSAGSSPGLGTSMDLALTGGEDLICTVQNRLPVRPECDSMTFDNVILGTPNSDVRDVLNGTNQNDIIVGYGGDDQIQAGRGDDCIAGNGGDDHITGAQGNDVIDGGAGDDRIIGGPGFDICVGETLTQCEA